MVSERESIDIVERLQWDKRYTNGHVPLTLEDAAKEIERLRNGFRAIKKAMVEGRVCDDVAWFDDITTLYDFCDSFLPMTATSLEPQEK